MSKTPQPYAGGADCVWDFFPPSLDLYKVDSRYKHTDRTGQYMLITGDVFYVKQGRTWDQEVYAYTSNKYMLISGLLITVQIPPAGS